MLAQDCSKRIGDNVLVIGDKDAQGAQGGGDLMGSCACKDVRAGLSILEV